jgi:hypothetical protein
MQKLVIKNPNKNTFNQYDTLRNMAASNGSSVFKYSDYNSITDPTLSLSYLYNLAANGKSLAERLPEQYSNAYTTGNEKAQILNYLSNMSADVDTSSAVSSAYSSDETMNSAQNAWVQWTVKNKFDGDYSKFLETYNDKGYQGMLDEGYFGDMPSETFTGLSEDTAKSSVDYMQKLADDTSAKVQASVSASYQEFLTALDYNNAERKRYQEWEAASESEKVWSSIMTLVALPVTELGNVVEGIIDAVATVIGDVVGIFSSDFAESVKNFVADDIIPLDTLLYDALPNAYTTSPYTSNWNGWKIAYNVGSSIVDMAPLALNMVVPGLGTAIYYTSMSGRTAEDYIQQNPDLSIYSATGYTIISTAIEYATENMSGHDFFGSKGISETFENFGSMNLFTKLIHNFIGEGLEEVVSETGQGIFYGIFTGDYSNLSIDNIGYAGLTGGVMGAFMSLSETAVSKIKVHNIKVYATRNGIDIPLNLNEVALLQSLATGDDNMTLTFASLDDVNLSKLSESDRQTLKKFKDIVGADGDIAAAFEALASMSDSDLQALAEGRESLLKSIKEKYGDKFSDKQLMTLARYYTEKAQGDTFRKQLKEFTSELKLTSTRNGKTVTTTYSGKTIAEAVDDNIKTTKSVANVSEQVKRIDTQKVQEYNNLSEEQKAKVENPVDYQSRTSEIERAITYGLLESDAVDITATDADVNADVEGLAATVDEQSTQDIDAAIETATENYKNAYSIYLMRLQQQFGQDAVINGIKWFYDELEATGNRLIEVSHSKPDVSANGKYASSAASKAFNSTIIATKTDNAKVMKGMFNAATNTQGNVYTFVTTKANIPSVFVIDGNLYVHQKLFESHTNAEILNMGISQYMAYDITKNADKNILSIIDKQIARNNLGFENISQTMQRQQLAYIMIFSENNSLISQLEWTSKESMNELMNYFKQYQNQTTSIATKNIIAQAYKTLNRAIIDSAPDSSIEAVQSRLGDLTGTGSLLTRLTNDDAIKTRNGHKFAFVADISQTTADVAVAAKFFTESLNFNYDFENGFSVQEFAIAIQNTKNFTDGGKALANALTAYDAYRLDPRTQAPTKAKSDFLSSLNYFLSDNFSFQIAPNNVVVHTESVQTMFSADAVQTMTKGNIAENVSDGEQSRYKLSNFLSQQARSLLGPTFADYNIYFVRGLNSYGWTASYATPVNGIGGYIMIDIDACESDMRIQNTLQHEMIHAIGNMTGFDQSLSDEISNKLFTDELKRVRRANSPQALESFKNDIAEYILATRYQKISDKQSAAKKAGEILSSSDERAKFINSFYLYIFANESNANVANVDSVEENSRGEFVKPYVTTAGKAFESQNNLYTETFGYDRTKAVTVTETRSELGLLKRFNNKVITTSRYSPATLKIELMALQNQTATREQAIRKAIDGRPKLRVSSDGDVILSLEEMKSLFGDEYIEDSKLQDRDFWVRNVNNSILKAAIKSMTNNQFSKIVEQYTKYRYNYITRQFGEQSYTDSEIKHSFLKPFGVNENYDAALITGYKPMSMDIETAAYNEFGSKMSGIVRYDAKSSTAVIQLGQVAVNGEIRNLIKNIESTAASVKYMVGSRTFSNYKAAMAYKNTSPINTQAVATTQTGISQFSTFDRLFNSLVSISAQTNKAILQDQFDANNKAVDTVYITNDGKVYGFGFDGKPLQAFRDIAKNNNISEDILGKYQMNVDTSEIIPNAEGLTEDLTRLLNAKRVVRMYRQNGEWVAYGIPNQIQDKFLLNYGIESKNTSYVPDRNNTVLTMFRTGEVSITKTDANGNFEGKEVPWKKNKYYKLICGMLSRYNITSFDQLYKLGFSEDFVNKLRAQKTDKNARRPGGIKIGDVDAYIDDTSNTTMSRNILIETFYGNNAHLRSVADIDSYLSAMQTYIPYMRRYNDNDVYSDMQSLRERYDKYMNTEDGEIKRAKNDVSGAFSIDHGEVYSSLLKYDADPNLPYVNNLDLSHRAFEIVLSNMKKGWIKTEIERKSVSAESGVQGRHADDAGEVSRLDEYAAAHGLTVADELSQASATELLEYVNKLNKLPTSEERSQLAQQLLDNWEDYFQNLDVSEDEENAMFDRFVDISEEFDTASQTKSEVETAEQREQKKNLATYLNSIKDELTAVTKATGDKQAELRAKAFTEFQSLKNNYEYYVNKYGEEGYKKIRQIYRQYGYSAETDVSSNYSKSKQRMQEQINKNLAAGKITSQQAEKLNSKLAEFDDIYVGLAQRLSTSYGERTKALSDFYAAYKKFLSAGKNIEAAKEALSEFSRLQEYLAKAAYEGKVYLSRDYVDENGVVNIGEQSYIDQAEKLKEQAKTTNDYSKYRQYLESLRDSRVLNNGQYWALQARVDAALDELDKTKPISAKPEFKIRPKTTTTTDGQIDVTKQLDDAAERQNLLFSTMSKSESEAYLSDVHRSNKKQSIAAQVKRANEAARIEETRKNEQQQMDWYIKLLRKQKAVALNSPAVSDIEVKNALKSAWELVEYDYRFKVSEQLLRQEANDWYSEQFKTDEDRLKQLNKLFKTADLDSWQKSEYRAEAEQLTKQKSEAIKNYIAAQVDSADKIRNEIKRIENTSTINMREYEKAQRNADLKELREKLSNFKFSEITERGFEDLTFYNKMSDKQRKILSGLNYAYTKLLYSPQTKYSLDEFNANVRSILEDGMINERIPGTSELKRIDFNPNLDDANARAILDKLKNAQYKNKYNAKEDVDLNQFSAMLDSYKKYGLPEDLSAARERYERGDMMVPDLKQTEADNRNDINFAMGQSQTGEKPIATKPKMRSAAELFGNTVDTDTDSVINTLTDMYNATQKQAITGEIVQQSPISKTTNSPLLNTKGIDLRQTYANFAETFTQTGKVDSEEFVKQNGDTLGKLQQSEEAAKNFLDWASDNPKLLNTNQLVLTAMLCNQIESSPKLSAETRQRAGEMFKTLKSLGGRLLAVSRTSGLTPLEEMAKAAMRSFDLTEEESNILSNAIMAQKQAIKDNNYKLADQSFEDALEVFRNHQDQLDTKINFFAKGLTEEQKAIRFQNFTDTITNWRYFAMLSSPSTFYAKNMVGNFMLKTLDKTSEAIGKATIGVTEKLGDKLNKNVKLAKEVHAEQLAAINEQLKTNKITQSQADAQIQEADAALAASKFQYTVKHGGSSDASKTAVQKALVDSGLVDSILAGTVTKYDSGYDLTKKHGLQNLTLDDDSISIADKQMLKRELTKRTPFGTSMAGQALNKYFNFIFNTMDKGDQKFVRKAIIEKTTKLVSDNFTDAEIQSINDGKANAETNIKLNDMIEYSTEQALQTYLRSTPAAYKTLMKFLEGHPVAKTIFSVICPFPRMLLNTISTGLSYSPVGFIKGLMTLKTDSTAFRNITANTQFSKAMTGTAVMAIGAALAGCGLIKIDDDDEYAGPQLILFNTFRISLEDFSPASIPLLVGASLTNGTQDGGFWNGLTTAMDTLLDATIFGELTSVFGGNKTGTDIIANTFTSMVTQFIPSIMRNVAKTIDPYKKNYSGNVLQKFYKKILAAIPGASFAVENKVDPYSGNYVTNYDDSNNPTWSRFLTIFNALSPTKVYHSVESELETESKAVGAATTGPSQSYTIDGTEYTIDDKTYNKYKVLRAKLYSQYASAIINKASYKRMTTEQKKAVLKKLQNQATTNARLQLGIGQ